MKKIIGTCLILLLLNCNVVWADDTWIEEDSNIENEIIEASTKIEKEPIINARAAVILDRNSKEIIWGKKENEKRPMASTTKIMTAIIVIEKGNLTDIVDVSAKAAGTGGSRLGLKKSDKVSVQDLLYGLLLVSGNDSAVALAEHIGGDIEGFAEIMNQKAEQLKLKSTHFVTPHGLDKEEHYTTALELAKMADYALRNSKFAEIVNTKNYTVSINGNAKSLSNTNELLGNLKGVNGVKTGFTNGANRCLVTSVQRDNMNIITVVLGADTKKYRTMDSVKLIEYAYQEFKTVDLAENIESFFQEWKKQNKVTIKKGITQELDLILGEERNKKITIKKEEEKDIHYFIDCSQVLESPVVQNQKIGMLNVYIKNENKLTIPIITKNDIRKKGMKDYWTQFMRESPFYIEKIINRI